jgi:MerR family transcriptional regulator, heat shock protein HspR
MKKGRSKAAYMISAVAEQFQIHPQTLRLYEREGLLKPSRSEGNTRLYTEEDLERLEIILKLTRDFGVNLAGVEIILNMREKMEAMQRQVEEFIATLNDELRSHIPHPEPPARNSLIPVITLPPVPPRNPRRAGTGREEKGGPAGTAARSREAD